MATRLKNLIKAAKGRDTCPVVPIVEEQFLRRTREPHVDPHWDGIEAWHPSSISYSPPCGRCETIRRCAPTLIAEPAPAGTQLQRTWDAGTMIHRWYQNEVFGPAQLLWGDWIHVPSCARPVEDLYEAAKAEEWCSVIVLQGRAFLAQRGLQPSDERLWPGGPMTWQYFEPALVWPEKGVVGHCDGIFKLPRDRWSVSEIKSIHSYGFSRLKKQPTDYHVRQVQLYLHALDREPDEDSYDLREPPPYVYHRGAAVAPGVKDAVVWYVEKDKQQERELWVQKSIDPVRSLLDVLEEIRAAAEEQKILPRDLSCKSTLSARAKDCEAVAACFNVDVGRSAWRELAEMAEMAEMAERANG